MDARREKNNMYIYIYVSKRHTVLYHYIILSPSNRKPLQVTNHPKKPDI